MPAARRRSMAEFLKEQQALDKPMTGDTVGAPAPADTVPAAVTSASSIPVPHSPAGDGPLTPGEQTDLATCEAALDNLRIAFWAAGKALTVIRDARLYRTTHDTFEGYVAERWEMSRAQAYRLIDAWPLAERLSPIGDNRLTESQVRELLPVADRHGQDAAVMVYRTVAEAAGIPVTAATLHGAVSVLPVDRFDPDEAIEQIRAYLAGTLPSPPPANALEAFTLETTRMLRALERTVKRGTLKAAATSDPDAVRQVIANLRAILDEIEHDTL